ncbi:33988_t:CDS:1, partial [Racocetra persica]
LYQEKEWENLKDLSPSQRKGLVEVLYKSRKLTKDEHQRILKQANQAYREEVTGQLSQLRYYKEKIGARSLSKQELIKSERFKYFFPEKGEHKEF